MPSKSGEQSPYKESEDHVSLACSSRPSEKLGNASLWHSQKSFTKVPNFALDTSSTVL